MPAMTEKIATVPGVCSGCLMCQLACSFAWTERFNPAHSRILIREISDNSYSIDFTDECNDCGICVSYCFYDALVQKGDNKHE